jgi:hypothetical protein
MSLQTKFKTHLVVKIECYISNGIGEWDAVLEMTNGSIEMPEVGKLYIHRHMRGAQRPMRNHFGT